MPTLLVPVIIAVGAAAGVTISTTAATLIASAIILGALIGLSLLFRPEQPKPSHQQQVYRGSASPRVKYYGRNKKGGLMTFLQNDSDNDLHMVVTINQGEVDAVEEHWVDDNLVTLDGSGEATSDPYEYDGDSRLKIEWRLGTSSQTYYSSLSAEFPTLWTTNHVGKGVAHAYLKMRSPDPEDASKIWPQGVFTVYRQVGRDSKVFDPTVSGQDIDDRTTHAWTEVSAPIILDLLVNPDCLGLPTSWIENALDYWVTATNICKEPVALQFGGTEQRYRASGACSFDERPADVIARFLESCDGVLIPTPNEGLALIVGKWETPTVTLDESSILAFSDFGRGRDMLTTANTIKAQYTSRLHDYQEIDADPWVDDYDVAERGEIVEDRQFLVVPSHSQCRRLMKIAASRANPTWTGSITTNLKGLAVLGQRFINIDLPELGISEPFEILSEPSYLLAEGNVLRGLTFQVISASADRYSWTPATEEGTEPIIPPSTPGVSIPTPDSDDLAVEMQNRVIGGSTVVVARLSFIRPTAYNVHARARLLGDAEWFAIPVTPGATTAISGALEDGETYQFQIRYVGASSRVGAWGPEPPIEEIAIVTSGS